MYNGAEDFFYMIVFYIIGGIVTVAIMTGTVAPDMTTAQAIAVGVFWPLFAIKYAVLGLWYLFAGLGTMLFS